MLYLGIHIHKMKKIITALIVTYTQFIYANCVYSDGKDKFIVSLGEQRSKTKLKVYKQGKIVFTEKKSLEQVEQYNTKKFMEFLEKEGLEFWLVQHKKALSTLSSHKIVYYHDKYSHWFNLAFQTQDGSAYGFIHFNYYSEKPYQYEVTLNMNGKVVVDNLMILKKEKGR